MPYVTLKVSKKDVCDHLTEIPRSGGLSQHASAISSLIVDVPLHYIIQNFKGFYFLPPPEILMMQRASPSPRMDAPVCTLYTL